jgi:Flp pilus assembly protein TadG
MMGAVVWLRKLRRFAVDESGAVLIYVTLLIPIAVGFGVLAVDFSRLANLNTALQKAADALALAGAAELDRKPTSITRADAAIANLLANKSKFSTAGLATVTASLGGIRYLQSLPANDATAIGVANVTTDPLLARYVEVTVTTATLNTILPASFLGGNNSSTTTARAVAGFNAAICKTVPMFICNPYEGSGISLFTAALDPALRRRQMKLQLGNGGGDSQFFPGNYGWLDTPMLGNGANALRDALAQKAPNSCYIQNGVSQKTGNIESANDALNVRFDLWDGPFNGDKNNPSYPPAVNVRKGYAPGSGSNGACRPSQVSPNNAKLGRDSAFPDAGGRLGNGTWDFDLYWSTNYGTTPKPDGLVGYSNSNLPSRYQVYRAEIETIGSGASTDLVARTSPGPYNEKGAPMCYSGGTPSDNPDRRVLYVAIINCSELNIHGNTGGPFPVLAFGKFFLTEPISNSPDPDAGTIFAELIDLAEPSSVSNEVSHDIVQLYR